MLQKKILLLTMSLALAPLCVNAGVMYRQPLDGAGSSSGTPTLSEEEIYDEWYNYAVDNNIDFVDDFSIFGVNSQTFARSEFASPLPTSPYPNKNPLIVYIKSSTPSAVSDLSGLKSIESVQYLDITANSGGVNNLNFMENVGNYASITINSPSLTDISGLSSISTTAHENSSLALIGNYSSANGTENISDIGLLYLRSSVLNDISSLSSLNSARLLAIGSLGARISDLSPLENLSMDQSSSSNTLTISGISEYEGNKVPLESNICSTVDQLKDYNSGGTATDASDSYYNLCDISDKDPWERYALENDIVYNEDFSYYASPANGTTQATLMKNMPPTEPFPNENPNIISLSFDVANKGDLDLSGLDSITTANNILLYIDGEGIDRPNYLKNLQSYQQVFVVDNDITDISGMSHLITSNSMPNSSIGLSGSYSDISMFEGLEDIGILVLLSPNINSLDSLSSLRTGSLRIGYHGKTFSDVSPISQLSLSEGTNAIGDISYYTGAKIPMSTPLCQSATGSNMRRIINGENAGSYRYTTSNEYRDYMCE